METKNINLNKMVYSVIDFFEKQDNPVGTIYKMINGKEHTPLSKIKDNMVNIVLTEKAIENAWNGYGAKDLAFLAILVHYKDQKIAFNGQKMLVTKDDIENQARKIRKNYSFSDSDRISEIINEVIQKYKKKIRK